MPDEQALRRERQARKMGLFDALLVTPSMPTFEAEGMKHLRNLVNVHEFILAFDLLTAIIQKRGATLSDDAWAILNHIAEAVGAAPENWHGLTRP